MYLKGTRPITASPAVGCGQCVCVALPSRAAAQIPRRGASAAQSTSAAGASVGRGPGPLASGLLLHFHLQQQAGVSARHCFGSLTTLCHSFSDSTPSSPLFLKSWEDAGTPPKVFLMVPEPPDVAPGSPGNDLIILVASTPPEFPPSPKPSPMVKSECKHVVGQLLDVSQGLPCPPGLLCPPPTPT